MIYLLWPTIRVKDFAENLKNWIMTSSSEENFKVIIAVDSVEERNYLLNEEFENIIVANNPDGGVVKPLNAITETLDLGYNDILVVASDDFVPPYFWDTYLLRQYEDFSGVFKVNDGQMKNIISMPVMDYKTFLKLNRIIYNKVYNHMFCDQELHDIVHELGLCKHDRISGPLFHHKHYTFGQRSKDEHDIANMNGFNAAKDLYQKRRVLQLSERLK
jgi:hypothetical protein